MNLADGLTQVSTIIVIVVPIVGLIWYVVNHPREWKKLLLAGGITILVMAILLVGVSAVEASRIFQTSSGTTPTPTTQLTPQFTPSETPALTSTMTPGVAYPAYLPGHGTLAFSDSLSSYNQANGWSTDHQGCNFKDNAYYVTSTNYVWACGEYAQEFTNFAFEVHIKLLTGTTGMLIFRADSQFANYYTVAINSSNGSYAFYKYTNHAQNTLKVGFNNAISNNTSSPYIIDIVANGSTLEFYLNQQKIDSVTDNAYNQGDIGFAVDGNGAGIPNTGAVFTDAEVWTL